MEKTSLIKAREHAADGKVILKAKEYEKALKQFEFSVKYFLDVLAGDVNPEDEGSILEESHEVLSRAESLKEFLHQGKDEHKAGSSTKKKSADESSDTSNENEAEYTKRIEGTLMTGRSSLTWDDVVGLDEAKQILNDAIILPSLFSDDITRNNISPCTGVMLYGAPGTGKTYLAQAAATETGASFFAVSVSDIASKYHGETQLMIRILFKVARERKPAIIFFDEVDSLCSDRAGRHQSEHDNQVKAELLMQMDLDGKHDNSGLFYLAATNLPQNIDSAFKRRFQKMVYIPLPDPAARKMIFEKELKKLSHNLVDADFEKLASYERLSGSDIKLIVKDAAMEPLRKTQQGKHFLQISDKFIVCSAGDAGAVPSTYRDYARGTFLFHPITMLDVEKYAKAAKPSVTVNEVLAFEKFHREYKG